MGMKFRFLGYALLPALLLCLLACGSNKPALSNGAGVLYVTAQGNSTVSAYSVSLGSGALSAIRESPTGLSRSADTALLSAGSVPLIVSPPLLRWHRAQ